jgi:hypothetical protein
MKLKLYSTRWLIVALTTTAAMAVFESRSDFWEYPYPSSVWATMAPGDTLPAFPGATGRAAGALDMARDSVLAGAWEYYIHIVSDTADSGPGTMDSVRTEILADPTAYHQVVFNVAGGWSPTEFDLTNVKNTYIACQTAPGSGFRFRSAWVDGDADSPDDLVAQYCHLKPTGSSTSMVQLLSGRKVLLDHMSVMFNSSDDLFEFYGQQDGTNTWTHEDLTVSWSIIGVGVTSGATGLAFHNDDQASDSRWGFVDAHHNVLGHLQNRAPKCNIDGTANQRGCKFVSNYVYNVSGQAFDSNDTVRYDAIENVVRAGPSWDGEKDRFFAHDTSHTQNDDPNPADILLSGNRVADGPTGWNPPLSQDSLLWSQDITKLGGGATWRTYTELPDATHPIVATTSNGLLAALSPTVGASRRVTCDGTPVSARDAQDSTLLAHAADGSDGPSTGYYASRTAANTDGFSPITRVAGTPCTFGANTLPNAYEVRYFGIADTVTAGADHDGDGYLTGEEWAHGTNPVGGAPGEIAPTWQSGGSRYAGEVGVINADTQIVYGTDTFSVTLLDGGDYPSQAVRGFYWWLSADSAEALLVTCDSALSWASLLDSATADAWLVAEGYGAGEGRARWVSGCQ